MSEKRLLRAAWVAPVIEPIIREGAIVVGDGGRVVAVGRASALRRQHPDAVTVELGDVVVLPGLVNAHTHLELSHCAAGDSPGGSFGDWIMSLPKRIGRDSGRWVGRCGPWCPPGWPGTEVGYTFARETWGRGYATEGAEAAMDFASDRLGWTEIIHTIAPDNLSSQQVARKLGSRNRGPGRLPPPFADARVDIWGQTRAEWKARRRL